MYLLLFAMFGVLLAWSILGVVNTIDYRAQFVADTARGPSQVIWGDCPSLRFIEDPSKGMYVFDDFLVSGQAAMSSIYKNSVGQWAIYAAAGSLIDAGALEGGVMTIKSGTDLDQTVLFSPTGSFRLVTTSTLALNQKLWFETRVARTSITTDTMEAFVGLADSQLATSLPAVNRLFSGTDDLLATTCNLIGFHARGDTTPGDWDFVYQLSGGTIVRHATMSALLAGMPTAITPAANTFYKLGFLFDPNAPVRLVGTAGDLQTVNTLFRPLITVFVNGLPVAAFLTSQNLTSVASGHAFPTGFMGPIFGTQMHATPNTLQIDWLRVAQLANS